MKNECYKHSSIAFIVKNMEKVKKTLENMQDGFKLFQSEASTEMIKYKNELLHLMFLRKKILVTFLGYQRAIDETIKIISLLLVIAWRRV